MHDGGMATPHIAYNLTMAHIPSGKAKNIYKRAIFL